MSKHGDVTQATTPGPVEYVPSKPAPRDRQYIAQTADFGIYVGVVPDEKICERRVYFVIHKLDHVVATDAVLLSYALEFMQRAQEALDTTTGKSSPHGAN